MNSITDINIYTILSGKSNWFEPELTTILSHHPLSSIETEFPHSVRSIDCPEGFERPKEQHPVFYGCYDWHSSVHSHWALIRQLRLFNDHPKAPEITASIDARFSPENIDQEVEYLEENGAFEKPYGWAWFLHFAAELSLWNDNRANECRSILDPLERKIVALVRSEFLSQDHPFRVGTHHNSTLALHPRLRQNSS